MHTPSPRPSTPSPATQAMYPARGRIVTSALIRLSHWLMATSFAVAYVTGDSERWRLLHVSMGYTLLGLLVLRVTYGLLGPKPARLSALWRRLAGAPAWWQAMRQAPSLQAMPWRQGQNLLLPLFIVLIMAMTVPLALSGHATYEDWGAAWGNEWATDALAEAHEALGDALLGLVLGHVCLILGLSLMRQRNLALPMLTGRSDAPAPVPRPPQGQG
jgi:cytochrome b